MPPLVRRYLKTAISFLIFGLLLGLHMGAATYAGWGTLRQPYVVAHTHVLLIGFLMLFAMGVALWMFPRRGPDDPRTGSTGAEIAYWLVTLGVVVRTTGEILSAYWVWRPVGIATFAAASAEALGIGLFFLGLWPRIRSPREALAGGGGKG